MSDIAFVAAPRICPPGARAKMGIYFCASPYHKDTKTQKLTQTRTWWIFVSSCLLYYEA